MTELTRIIRSTVFLWFGNSYLNYMYQYCYKYLMIKHGQINQAIALATIIHVLFTAIVALFFLLVLKPHPTINRIYKFDTRLRREFYCLNSQADDISPIELSSRQVRRLSRFVSRRKLKIATRNSHGQIAICLKCLLVKPDRCYHCQKCGRCILKRDHHCPWFNTCVGYANQKYYLLLLIYVQAYIILILGAYARSLIKNSDSIVETRNVLDWFQYVNFHVTIISAVCIAIPVLLLIVNNFYLASKNMTHIELAYPPRVDWSLYRRLFTTTESLFDLGSVFKNQKQIFGDRICLAFFPIWTTPGDGHEFPINSLVADSMV